MINSELMTVMTATVRSLIKFAMGEIVDTARRKKPRKPVMSGALRFVRILINCKPEVNKKARALIARSVGTKADKKKEPDMN